ncbi:MAG: hypothetical protein HY308_15860 [Gammaproteobacteria bacterium]|nr:hypothetical protein [Gammaproteobacteria bacterium]
MPITTDAVINMTFFYWMRDDSRDAMRTQIFLARQLQRLERLTAIVPGWPSVPTVMRGPNGPTDLNL